MVRTADWCSCGTVVDEAAKAAGGAWAVSAGVYVAGRTNAVEPVRAAQRVCIDAGFYITFDWTGAEGEIRKDWSMKAGRARELSMRERQAVLDAALLVLVWTGTDRDCGVGNLLETGMALALGRTVIVVGPARESVFWYLPNVIRVPDLDGLADQLATGERAA